jgi:hypothetical protein
MEPTVRPKLDVRLPAGPQKAKGSRKYHKSGNSRKREASLQEEVYAKWATSEYGGAPGRFHFNGMSGTPKDGENIAALESFVTSSSNTVIRMVQCLGLRERVAADPVLNSWYKDGVSG